MPIDPLPVFEADADPRHREAMSDVEIYERLEPPKTVVVRFGYLKQIGEYDYDGEVTPGCGSRLVARTHRGTEIVEMLTTTCDNSGCAKSVTRQEMLDYIEGSGGKDFPFRTSGKILHVATIEELNKQSALDSNKKQHIKTCKTLIDELELPMKLVEVEPILGEELLTFYFMAKDRVDFRKLVRRLAGEFKTRIEMRQVGASDEARLVADYERCGQHCCCKSFLKVLKPVSMKSAKLQKATLDPLKISGRCGRLMCCLRYEDQTYDELRKNLPKKGKRVGTSEGPGRVVDTKILVQLALVKLEHNDQAIAVPVEELMDPDQCPKPGEAAAEPDALRGLPAQEAAERADDKQRGKRGRRRGPKRSKTEQQDAYRAQAKGGDKPDEGTPDRTGDKTADADQPKAQSGQPKRRRRRRRRRGGNSSGGNSGNPG
jgi:cell fate regulator YaaT (PSP1 superfamily)